MVSFAPFKRKAFIGVTAVNRLSTVGGGVAGGREGGREQGGGEKVWGREREEKICCVCVFGSLLHTVRDTVVDQPWTHPNCLPSLAREVSYRLRRNCSLRVGQVKCYGI